MPNTVRKPTAELEASGAFQKNPARSRKREPNTGRGIGPAPAHLDDDERAVWDEIVGNCAAGVFQSSDRPMMEVLCTMMAEFRRDRAGFGGRRLQALLALMSRCGMTPSDRSRVMVAPSEPEEGPKVGLAKYR